MAPVLCVLADNARASELINHMGSSARQFCRMCNVHQYSSLSIQSMVLLCRQMHGQANPGCVSSPRNKTQVEEQIRGINSESTEAEKMAHYGIKEKK